MNSFLLDISLSDEAKKLGLADCRGFVSIAAALAFHAASAATRAGEDDCLTAKDRLFGTLRHLRDVIATVPIDPAIAQHLSVEIERALSWEPWIMSQERS